MKVPYMSNEKNKCLPVGGYDRKAKKKQNFISTYQISYSRLTAGYLI